VDVRSVPDLVDVSMQPVGSAVRADTHLGIGQTNVRILCRATVDLRVGGAADKR
jgi:hypothetical protein